MAQIIWPNIYGTVNSHLSRSWLCLLSRKWVSKYASPTKKTAKPATVKIPPPRWNIFTTIKAKRMPKPVLIKKIEPACITVKMLLYLHNATKTCKDGYRNTFAWVEQDITSHEIHCRLLISLSRLSRFSCLNLHAPCPMPPSTRSALLHGIHCIFMHYRLW